MSSGEYLSGFSFSIITVVPSTGRSNAFALLSGQIMVGYHAVFRFCYFKCERRSQIPQGYSDQDAGLMGATLLLCGIAAAVVTAPLFDRVFTSVLPLTYLFTYAPAPADQPYCSTHLARTMKTLVPIVAGGCMCCHI